MFTFCSRGQVELSFRKPSPFQCFALCQAGLPDLDVFLQNARPRLCREHVAEPIDSSEFRPHSGLRIRVAAWLEYENTSPSRWAGFDPSLGSYFHGDFGSSIGNPHIAFGIHM